MATTTHAPLPAPDAARWLWCPAHLRAACVLREAVVAARGGAFEVRLRACDDGGYVATFPALPQLMTRGVTCQHARIKALALVESYLRDLQANHLPATAPASTTPADDRQRRLPLAA